MNLGDEQRWFKMEVSEHKHCVCGKVIVMKHYDRDDWYWPSYCKECLIK